MKNMKFKGTLIAIAVIIGLIVVSKFVYKEDFERKEIVVEPTETPTLEMLENTKITTLENK